MHIFAEKPKDMPIKRSVTLPPSDEKQFRDILHDFAQDESGIRALGSFIGRDNSMSREGMYLLEILNNLISSNNGTEKVFQRIPPEVFGGLPEGGRRNVQASLIARAVSSADEAESRRVNPSGYTTVQEIIGSWSERDGSWSDTPEEDLLKKGYYHDPSDDGSEARIFDPENGHHLVKTIDMSHYNYDFNLMMDRIAIHNAAFPEMALTVEGFGVREDAEDNTGFVLVCSQPKAVGRTPTKAEIEDGMKARFFDLSQNGLYWISGLDNIVIEDVNVMNAVTSPEGRLLVFDCDARLKCFPAERLEAPLRFSINDFLPNGREFNNEAWHALLGDDYALATENEKSQLLVELRSTGKINGLVCGCHVEMDNPEVKYRTLHDGRTQRYYDGDVLIGKPASFSKEKVWTIPPLQYDQALADRIHRNVSNLMPYEVDIDTFLSAQRWSGLEIASRGNGDIRRELKNELLRNGRLEGLINGQYHVQLKPGDKETVLVQHKNNVAFMLWPNGTDIPGLGKLTPQDKKDLAEGKAISKNGRHFFFNLDRGRVDDAVLIQRKLKLTQSHLITLKDDKKKDKPNRLRL